MDKGNRYKRGHSIFESLLAFKKIFFIGSMSLGSAVSRQGHRDALSLMPHRGSRQGGSGIKQKACDEQH